MTYQGRMKKRWIRFALLLPASLVAILVAFLLFVQTPFAGRLIARQVRSYLIEKYGADLRCTGLRLNLLNTSVEIDDVAVHSTSTPGLPPVFQADTVRVKVGLGGILRGVTDLERIEIGRPQVSYVIGKDGRSNIPEIPPSSGEKTSRFLISQAIAENGSFRYEDARDATTVIFPYWQLSIAGNRETFDHEISLTAGPVEKFQIQGRVIPLESLTFSGLLQPDDLRIRLAEFRFPGSIVAVSGSITDLDAPGLELQISPDLDLGRIISSAGLNWPVKGRVAGTISVVGASTAPSINGRLTGRNIDAGRYRKTRFDLRTSAEITSEEILLRDVRLVSPEGSLNASGRLSLSPEGSSTLDVGIRDFNLYGLGKQLDAPFDIASLVTGRVALRWKGAFALSRIRANANLDMRTSTDVHAPDLLPLSGTLHARMQSDRIDGELRDFSVMGSRIAGSFSLDSLETLQANLEGTIPEIDSTAARLAKFLGDSGDDLAGLELGGAAHFQVQAAGQLQNPALTVSLEASELRASEFKHLKAQVNAAIEGPHIELDTAVTFPQESTLNAHATLDTQGEKTLLDLNASIRAMPVLSLLASLEKDIEGSGTFTSELHVSGPMDAPEASLEVTSDPIWIEEQPVGQLDLALHLSEGRLRSERFRIVRDRTDPDQDYLDARITYVPKSREFSFQANGKALDMGRHTFGGTKVEGRINLTASGKGTIDNPSIAAVIESDDIRVQQRSLGPVTVTADLLNQDLSVKTTAPRLNLASNVHMENRSPFPFQGSVEARNLQLALFEIGLAKDELLAGAISALVKGSGNLEDLSKSRVTAHIENVHLESGALKINSQGPIDAEYRDNTIELKRPAIIASGDSRLELAGRVPLEKSSSEGTLTIRGEIDLEQAAGFLPPQRQLAAAGKMYLNVALSGAMDFLAAAGVITVQNGRLQHAGLPVPLTGIEIRSAIEGGALTLQRAEASFGEAAISARGELPFGLLPGNLPVQFYRKQGPAQLVLDVDNLRPEATEMLPEGISGLLSLHAEGEAKSFDLEGIRATAAFQDLRFKANQIEIAQQGASTIVLQDGVASVARFTLTGTGTNIDITGSFGLLPGSPVDLRLAGDFNAGLLTFVDQNLKAAGRTDVRVVVGGTREDLKFAGIAEMNGGRVTLVSPRLVADSLTVRLSLTPEQLTLQELKGTLNGGSVTAEGTVASKRSTFDDFDLKMRVQDVFFDYPQGLKSSSSGDLTFTSQDDFLVVGGTVRIQESSYREDFTVTGQLMNFLKSQGFEEEVEPNPFLDRIRFNVAVRTVTPLQVQNNVASIEATANLRLVGTVNDPSVTGRITLNEGGEIILNNRSYFLDRGSITLTDQTRIRPELDLQAQTKAHDYQIILELTGTPDKLTTTLRDESQVLTERQIISLLLTGKTDTDTQDTGANGTSTAGSTMKTQALSLLAGQAGEQLTREARQALRLSTFRIDPGMIQSESETAGPRLTLGDDITSKLGILYSMSLEGGGKEIVSARYDIARRLSVQTTKQEDNIFRFQMLHDLRFGGATRQRSGGQRRERFEIGSIEFKSPTPSETLLGKFKAKPGDKYDFPKIQKGLDNLQEYYRAEKRLEADIRLERETSRNKVNLDISAVPGPVVSFVFEGVPLPQRLKKEVEEAWTSGVFDVERLDDAVSAIRFYLLSEGYLQAAISHRIETDTDSKTVYFNVEPGVRYAGVSRIFPGASRIKDWVLNEAIDRAGLGMDVYTNPRKVSDFLKRYYQQRGYLQTKVSLPLPELDPETGTGKVVITIDEGPQFLVGELEFTGNASFEYDELWSIIPTSIGSIFNTGSMQDAVKALEDFYRARGYNEVTVTYRVSHDPAKALANVLFQITERRKSVIREIVVEGNQRTSQSFVLSQLDFQVGDVLDVAKINESRRRFYATRVYSSVDFITEETPGAQNPQVKNVRIRVRLREVQPYRFQYGFLVDTEGKRGGLVELQNLNLLGRASALGMRLRIDSEFKEGRLYFSQPFVTKIHLKMDATAFYQEESRDSFWARRIGFSIFREKELPGNMVLNYGYRYDNVKWSDDFSPDPTIFHADVPVARLITSITRDTRDSALDATRGDFTSHSMEFGPKWLGSDIGFARYYGQFLKYVPLEKYFGMRTEDEEGKPVPSSFVFASALRLGLTSAFGSPPPDDPSPIISPERFFAGGGTTMRGFPQDLLGPTEIVPVKKEDGTIKPVEKPKGGEGLFLFNNELRFPLFSIFQGVVFLDVGNVYPRLADFDFTLRKTAGAGLRAKIKFIPLRFDYGWKLDRLRPGESAGEFFFSIGQAF
ncbi:MAG: BamA/TamA family outer membrane protein [Acidobacteria bacterium]|nr:BamA/TamA family outer membrane protein [Acidobacteriota bacterium]